VQEAVEAVGGSVGIGARELYSDAMGAPEEFGGSYIGMIATNIVTVMQGFGYEVVAFPAALGELPQELTESASS